MLFPNLSDFQITSKADNSYNCIAWAFGDQNRFWWPNPQVFWPSGAPMSTTIAAFKKAFELSGYVECPNSDLENGFEKIALYVKPNGEPTHAARQLPSGSWTSKLGVSEDIEHKTLRDLEGPVYGKAIIIMKRPMKKPNPP